MISAARMLRLRADDTLRKIARSGRIADDVIAGRHPYFRFLGGLSWCHDHPGESLEDWGAWSTDTLIRAREFRAKMDRRMALVEAIVDRAEAAHVA